MIVTLSGWEVVWLVIGSMMAGATFLLVICALTLSKKDIGNG